MFKIYRSRNILFEKLNLFSKKIIFGFSRFNNNKNPTNTNNTSSDKGKIIDVTNENKLDKSMLNINIPKSNFNERLNTKENETKFLTKLTQEFYLDQMKCSNRKLWVTHDGPSFANGKPHIGLLYNKVMKDALNRLKIMQGYKVHYNIGFDCYGVNIEDQVVSLNKKKKINDVDDLYNSQFESDHSLDEHKTTKFSEEQILKLRGLCRTHVSQSIIDQLKYFLRVGVMFDVNSVYYTMSKEYENLQLEVFKQMYEKGLVYRDNRVIFWSAEEKRIVDFDDLDEKTEIRDCIVVKFPIKTFEACSKYLEDEYTKKGKKLYLLGFLSEPWKYVGVRALAFNPENNYCIAKIKEDYFICSYKRLPELSRRLGEKKPEILHVARGSAFANLIASDPIFNRDLPIVINQDVTEFFGTGINIISPAHDFISEKIARNYKLSLEGFLNDDNQFTHGLGLFLHNTNFMDGNQKVISKLNSSKHLFASWKFENTYYENKKNMERIVLRSIPSWFMKLNKKLKMECFKELSLLDYYPDLNFDKGVDSKTRYQPHKLKKVKEEADKANCGYMNIVEELDELDEWCISEINSWGAPIPYFIYKINNKEDLTYNSKILFNSEIIDHIRDLFYKHGNDIWWTWPVEDLLPSSFKSEADQLIKGKENFESWFDSSISWYTVLYKNNEIPINEDIVTANIKKEDNLNLKLDSVKIEKKDILNRTKEHLKSLNNKLREFILNSMKEKMKKTNNASTASASENSEKSDEETNESSSQEETLDLKSVESVRSILPKEETISHIKQKCMTYGPSNLFPADVLIEGHDQHSNWFLQSMLTSIALTNHSPFLSVKTHGFIQDSAGNKLSKSMRNFIDPIDIIDGSIKSDGERNFGYGSDALRLYFLKNDTDRNFKLFEENLETAKSDLKLIRKMSKVCLGLLNDYTGDEVMSREFKFNEANILDQIIINEFVKFVTRSIESLEKYNFKQFTEGLIKFISETFIECYLEPIRRNVILFPADSTARLAHQFVINEIFMYLNRLMTPIIPLTCEDIYSHCDHIKSKQKYAGFEPYPTLENVMMKFKYTFNQDLNFNGENLFKIKREMNKEIVSLLQNQNYVHLKRNELEIVLLTAENEEEYGGMLLETLGDNLSGFLNVANVYLSEEEYPDPSTEILRKRQVYFNSEVPYDKSVRQIEVRIKYAIVKSKKHECPRCLYHKAKQENKICEECRKMMIDTHVNKMIKL